MNLDLSKGSREQLLAIIVLVMMAIFVVRLFYLQIIQHDHYVSMANAEQLKQLDIPAARGMIYAQDRGVPVPLVMNQTVYTVFADPSIIRHDEKVIDMIKKVAGGNSRPNIAALLKNKKSRYAVLATNISRTQAEQMKQRNLLGVGFTTGSQRVYPEGQLGSQILGFVNASGEGQYGIEGQLNQRLKGVDGQLKTITDVRAVPLTIGNKNVDTPAKDGDNTLLTIDRNIQAYAEKALAEQLAKNKAKSASALVMDPRTGKVLAMANLPTYDPAEYGKVTDAEVFQNSTISSPYEPGSDIKILTAATGINTNAITRESTYYNSDSIQVDDITISNATKGKTGTITMQTALNYSLNTGFVTIAQRLGNGRSINLQARNTIYDYFHNHFRLGQMTGIELQGEAPGNVISPKSVQGNAVRYSNMVFGQGMDATMLQVTAAFGAVINNGTYYYPSIIEGTIQPDGSIKRAPARESIPNTVTVSTSETMRAMIEEARKIFAQNRRDDPAGYAIGGKTGTTQAIVNGTYSFTTTIGTYLGYGGETGAVPNYIVMVRVMPHENQVLSGERDAMPVFTNISNWMINYLKLSPKG